MTNEELYASHIAEGMPADEAAALVGMVVNWPRWSLNRHLEERLAWAEHELEEVKMTLREMQSA